jgi:hypothetical protein
MTLRAPFCGARGGGLAGLLLLAAWVSVASGADAAGRRPLGVRALGGPSVKASGAVGGPNRKTVGMAGDHPSLAARPGVFGPTKASGRQPGRP